MQSSKWTPVLIIFGVLAIYGSAHYLSISDYNKDSVVLFLEGSRFYFNLSIWFFLVVNTSYLVILILGFINARKQFAVKKLGISKRLTPLKALKPISILLPSYNEEAGIKASIDSMMRMNYPHYEVVVCNDGSKDNTMEVLKEAFKLKEFYSAPPKVLPSKEVKAVYRSMIHENLIVIDKENGGKADALNASINYSQFPLICCVDSDSVIDREGLMNVSLPFLEDDNIIATGGTILLADTSNTETINKSAGVSTNVSFTWMGMIQAVEYLRAFLVGRTGWDYIGCDAIISGAFGLFKKSLVIRVGGYSVGTIGEDMELLLRMQCILPTPVCWTEAPSDIKTLGNQRVCWTQGLAESLWIHRGMFFRPWAGRIGSVALPYYFCFELLSAPIELFGYSLAAFVLGLKVYSPEMIAALFGVTILYGCVLNLGALVIDQMTFEKYKRLPDLAKLTLGAFLEHFGFRQMHLYWRIKGCIRWLLNKQSWGEMKRVGIGKTKP